MAEKSWIDKLLEGVLDTAGGVLQTGAQSAPLLILAKFLQDQADKGAVMYPEAKEELVAKSAKYEKAMTDAAAPAADVTKMRAALTERAYNPPLKPLTVNAPARFNPYASTPGNPNPAMGGAVSPTMLAKVQSLAQNRNQTTQWGGNALQTQLSQRMGTRDMRVGNKSGALTPLPLREHPVAETGMNDTLDALTKPKIPGTVDKPFIPGIGTGLNVSTPKVGDKRDGGIEGGTVTWDGTKWVPDTQNWLADYNPPSGTQYDLAGLIKRLQAMQGGMA